MTKQEFTKACAEQITGILKAGAIVAYKTGNHDLFVQELIEQDSDEGSRSGTARALGPDLYEKLQSFKPLIKRDYPDPNGEPPTDGGDNCVRCGNPIDHNDPHLYCSNCG